VAVYHLAFGHVLNLIRPILFKIPHFTLPNIIMGKEVIRELLAYEFTEDNVYAETSRLLNDSAYRQTMLNNYALLRELLGKRDAPTAAAESILSDLR
jgi:lipid-A-disaccharide synthase